MYHMYADQCNYITCVRVKGCLSYKLFLKPPHTHISNARRKCVDGTQALCDHACNIPRRLALELKLASLEPNVVTCLCSIQHLNTPVLHSGI